MPDVSMVHVDQALTNLSIQYRNQNFVSEELFPVVPVGKQSNKYFIYSKDRFRVVDDARRPGAKANEIDWTLSTDTFYAEGHALAQAIPDELRSNQDPALDIDADTTETLTDLILVQRESAVAAVATSTSVVTNHKSAAAWDTNASTPITDIQTGKTTILKATGKYPNRLLLSYPAFSALQVNSSVRSALGIGNPNFPGNITAELLAQAFGLEKVIIAAAIENTAAEGAADSLDFIWGKNAILYHTENGGLRSMTFGREFRWTFGANTEGVLVKRYREENRTADIVEAQRYYDLKTTVAAAAYLFDGCVS